MYATVDAQAPSEQDFGDIYKAYYRRVFSLCRYLLNSFEAAEDATHEVFLRAQRKLASYDPSLPLSSWLLAITVSTCFAGGARRGDCSN
jgi:RNA polymerase sigma-70 factor (ECF subfamily)